MTRYLTTSVALALLFAAGVAQASDPVSAFLKDVESGRGTDIINRLDQSIYDEVELPVLEVFIDSVNERLGKVRTVTRTGVSYKWSSEGKLSERSVSIQFEKGDALFKIATRNDKILMFDFQSEQLGDWSKNPADTSRYEQLAYEGLHEILRGDAVKAREMWHNNLKKIISEEKLHDIMALIESRIGGVKAIRLNSIEKEHDDFPRLRINFDIEAEKTTSTGYITIQFENFKGWITGFNVSLPAE